jgi:hypothetical protein
MTINATHATKKRLGKRYLRSTRKRDRGAPAAPASARAIASTPKQQAVAEAAAVREGRQRTTSDGHTFCKSAFAKAPVSTLHFFLPARSFFNGHTD